MLNIWLDMKAKLIQKTGDQKEKFHKLRIKDNVDHAGHFQQLVL